MKQNVRLLTMASVFSTMILLTTLFPFLRVMSEYAHIGDGMIYLACMVLPAPYAMLAGAVGAALADTFLGFLLPWAPISLVIKAAMAFVLCRFVKGGGGARALGLFLASAINVGGYFLASWAFYGLGAAVAGLPLNLVQSAVAVVLFLALGKLVTKAARKYVKTINR